MTQKEVGDRVGITADPVTRLETEKQINGEYLAKICESLGIQKRLLTCAIDVWVEKVAILKSKPIVPMRDKKALP
jgi:transcriptional regulator with XRE-family HTH domain